MNKMLTVAAGVLVCCSAMVRAMDVETHCKENDETIYNVSKEFEEDYLFAGNELNFSGEAQDMVFLGKTLTYKGKTRLGLVAIGKKILFSGETGNGITAAGVNIVVDGNVSGNNYIGCKNFQLTERGAIDGDLFLGCAKGTVDGSFNGNLHVGAGELQINSVINGDVTAYGGRIRIGKKGKINGNLIYGAKEKLSVEELARVSGTVTVDDHHEFKSGDMLPKKMRKWVAVLFSIGMFLSFAVIGSLLLFLPVFRKLDAPQQERTFWYTSLWGLIPLLMYPAVVILSFALVVTIPFAVVLLFAFVPLFFTAYLIGTTLAGKYIAMKLRWNAGRRHLQFLIGAVAGVLLAIIPFINFLSGIFLLALGWGTFITFLFNTTVGDKRNIESSDTGIALPSDRDSYPG
ncbi:MAG: hypothetical protein JW863_01230 [Chitinispirillaceae bacterium]|nr:hypothetical protein [Chitinispirillaceae bacterium]